MVLVLALVGWPLPARGVRAVVAAERVREYAESARALGASRTRLLLRHLLPAARGFLVVQATLLVPGVRPRRGDPVVCRSGLRRADPELGCDVTRGRPGPRPRRGSVASRSGHRYRARRARREPRPSSPKARQTRQLVGRFDSKSLISMDLRHNSILVGVFQTCTRVPI